MPATTATESQTVAPASASLGVAPAITKKRQATVNNKTKLKSNFEAIEIARVMHAMVSEGLLFLPGVPKPYTSLYSMRQDQLLNLITNSKVIPTVYARCASTRDGFKKIRQSFTPAQKAEQFDQIYKLSGDLIRESMKTVIAQGSTEPLSKVAKYQNLRKKDLVTLLVRDGYGANINLAASGLRALAKSKQAGKQAAAASETVQKEGSIVVGSREQLEAVKAAKAAAKKKVAASGKKH